MTGVATAAAVACFTACRAWTDLGVVPCVYRKLNARDLGSQHRVSLLDLPPPPSFCGTCLGGVTEIHNLTIVSLDQLWFVYA